MYFFHVHVFLHNLQTEMQTDLSEDTNGPHNRFLTKIQLSDKLNIKEILIDLQMSG